MIERPVIGVLEYVLTEAEPVEKTRDEKSRLTATEFIISLWNLFLFGPAAKGEDLVEEYLGEVVAHASGTAIAGIIAFIIGMLISEGDAALTLVTVPLAIVVISLLSVISSAISAQVWRKLAK